MTAAEDPSGLAAHVAAIDRWLTANAGLQAPIAWRPLGGGHSNLTFHLVDSVGRAVVLRCPPPGNLHPTAHDMGREYQRLEVLAGSPVPAPEPVAFCDDRDVLDRDFYVMTFSAGRSLHSTKDVDGYLDFAARRRVGPELAATLAAIHRIDIGARQPTSERGERRSYIARQIGRWSDSWERSGSHPGDALFTRIRDQLVANEPAHRPPVLVHGDFGIHNARILPDGRVAAIVDWEVSTIGDALADLAYFVDKWVEDPQEPAATGDEPTAMEGFGTRADLVVAYEAASGAAAADLEYYVCFNRWRRAAILLGIHQRYTRGQKDASGVDVDAMPHRIDHFLAGAGELADRW